MDCKNKEELEGYVYIDENGNGVRELTEKGIKRSTIELQDENGKTIQTTSTIDTGRYAFLVCPDDYKVKATYTQGESSYLDRYEATVTKENFAQEFNFKVLKGEESSLYIYILLSTFILGVVAIGLVYKLLSKRGTHSL